MTTKRYRFNRKNGKIYLENGKELREIGTSLQTIILWASKPVYGKPFDHLAAQNWVQLTFLDNHSNWCYALLNSGATDALYPWFEYRQQVESQDIQLRGVITTISLVKVEAENDFFDYHFAGVKGKPGLEERMNQLVRDSEYSLIDTSVNLLV
jgi:hypothetical protein